MNIALIILIILAIIAIVYFKVAFKDPYPGLRDTIHYGYYGDMASQYEEVKDHVNTVWIAAWDSHPQTWVDCVYDRVVQASKDGKKSVVMMTTNTYVDRRFSDHVLVELKELFNKLSAAGVLKNVVAIYPTDEPDGSNISPSEIKKGNDAIRSVMLQYPSLRNTALAVFYTGSEQYPGIEYYDWVGFDEYHKGEKVLGAKYKRMVSKLRSDQRTMIIPGGCDKWRQDPRPFVDFALSNPRVVAVVPFIWIDNAAPENADVGLGIKSNGLKELYKEAARTLVG